MDFGQQAARAIICQNFQCFLTEVPTPLRLDFFLKDKLSMDEESILNTMLDVEDAAEFVKYLNQANPHPFIILEHNPLSKNFKEKFAKRNVSVRYLLEGVNGLIAFPKEPRTEFIVSAKGLTRKAILPN